ncbi:gliding motility-associated C-terminal domain-containing protein [Nonlabens sp. Hel1_33_55]|uniref:gliding motility-associated C-terminal domain-containing protein n=1 Tax=Nonlabens sp. Hel1_33_55 TaxID=1336802 RepID=UPI000875BC3E|nr:gliding motility-associated C-terminal domain-containing protein [Nonlabens sp. Hel1_33_55]SCX96948.1 gliding motility-associated C-terminal domain-containing protein [Nonlabens sp. Hel1_33_55]
MTKQILAIGMMLMCFAFAKAQLESSQWFFGENAGVDFRSGNVESTAISQMQTGEGCATLSDEDGNLLFYTDGSTVYNRNHEIMVNGTGLKGNSSSTSSAVAVPFPDSTNLFYIFTVDTDDLVYRLAEGMHYSIVDMTLDNGNGGILQDSKNTLVLERTSEKLTAIENATNTGYWIITQFEDRFYSYELTASGLNMEPVISQVDPFIELVDFFITNVDVAAMRGYIKVNSSGTKLAAAHFSNNTTADFDGITGIVEARSLAYAQGGELYLYDFDNNTGIVSNPIPLLSREDNGSYYGIEFSPDGNYLYAEIDYLEPSVNSIFNFIGGEIAQFDLNATDIAASKRTIHQDRNQLFRGALQIGIDGNIYHARINQNALSVLSNPNNGSVPVSYGFNQQSLQPGTISVYGLPIFVQSFFQEFTIRMENGCDGDAITYSLETNTDDYEVVWNFGDPQLGTENTSTAREGSVVFSGVGTYEVSATITTLFQTITLSETVIIYPQVAINETDLQITECDLGTGATFFNLSAIPETISNIPEQTVSIHENQEDALNNEEPINVTVPYLSDEESTVLYVKVQNENCFQIRELRLIIENCPVEIFNTLTPNGDGSNDSLQIAGLIGIYENFEISIFNRYGRAVWNGGPDNPNWDGTSNVAGTDGELLPAGTYYYVVQLNDPEVKDSAGYIYLTY